MSTKRILFMAILLSAILSGFAQQTETVTIEKDKHHTVTVAMQQQVRQLTLELEITGGVRDHITGIDATLSGVAGAIDITNGNPAGNAVTVSSVFTLPDGRDAINRVFTATLRLPGILGNAQTLSLTLHFAGGNPASYTLASDLSSLLAAFNTDKKRRLPCVRHLK